MRKKFVEKILASCCQHVNGIRFEESTMTKYRTVGSGGGGGESFAPPPFQILASMKQANPFPPKGIPWITTYRFSDLPMALKNCYLLAVTKRQELKTHLCGKSI